MPDFLLYALIGGFCIAAISGPLGCFVVWRRMAYFGDTLAHSALLGVALGLFLEINNNLAISAVCILIALGMLLLQKQHQLAADTLLGIFAHSSLAVGLIIVGLLDDVRVDINSYLFGDLLAISANDLVIMAVTSSIVGILLIVYWRPLLMLTIHEELAAVEGIPVRRYHLLLMLMFSVIIATAMKIIGVLLITSMLIVPAASARWISNSPESMAFKSILIGMIAVAGGLVLSYNADTAAGPSVVVCAFSLFIMTYLYNGRQSA